MPSGWLLPTGPRRAAWLTGTPEWDFPNPLLLQTGCSSPPSAWAQWSSRGGYHSGGCRSLPTGIATIPCRRAPQKSLALRRDGAVSHAEKASPDPKASVIGNHIKMDRLPIGVPFPKAVALLYATHTSLACQARANYPIIGISSHCWTKRPVETRVRDAHRCTGEERAQKDDHRSCRPVSQIIQRRYTVTRRPFINSGSAAPAEESAWDTPQTENRRWSKQQDCSSPDATASITGCSCDAGSPLTKQPDSCLLARANFRPVYLRGNNETRELCLKAALIRKESRSRLSFPKHNQASQPKQPSSPKHTTLLTGASRQ